MMAVTGLLALRKQWDHVYFGFCMLVCMWDHVKMCVDLCVCACVCIKACLYTDDLIIGNHNLILHSVVMTANVFVWVVEAVWLFIYQSLGRPVLDSLANTTTYTHTHTCKSTPSPSPVNVWNKWLLQRRQCEHTIVSHLIGRLHENLFVLDRVCNNPPVS